MTVTVIFLAVCLYVNITKMEEFLNIDWHPSINDIIDNEFVNIERLEKTSAMYRILRDKFVDPSKNIYEDFLDLVKPEDIELMKKQAIERKNQQKNASVVSDTCLGKTDKTIPKKSYVPGIVPCTIKFPRSSSLTVEQHAICVKILNKFSASGKPDISTVNKDELTMYMNLQSKITEEQEEYLKIAKENWNPSHIKIDREDLINLKWKYKLNYVLNLHRYYTEVGTIPFVSEQEIKCHFDSTLLDVENLPQLSLPSLEYRYKLVLRSDIIEKKYFTPSKLLIKNQIIEDKNCQKFVQSNHIDLVISSSGLQCLASSVDPSHSQVWILPFCVKEVNGKNVVFIDKPLAPQAKNVLQKNLWIYKYAVKSFLIKSGDSSDCLPNNNKYVDLDKSNDTVEIIKENVDEPMDTDDEKQPVYHYQYNIFTIGACGLLQNEMMKNKIDKDYKILVRSKIDAIEQLDSGEIAWVKIAPKLEHQLGLGAEAVSLEEAAKQWVTSTFTPDTSLLRIRINQRNSEFIQYERRSPMSINNELKRLHNIRGEDILAIVYNITENMTKMSPGNYLLRHTVRNGAFASIYKAVDNVSKNTIDLQAIYCDEEFRTIPNPPWPLIDKTLLTPALICFKRMPAMFYPSKVLHNQSIKSNKKKKAKKRMNNGQVKSSQQ